MLRAVGEGPKRFGLDIDEAAVGLAAASLAGEHEIAVGDFLDAERWPLSEAAFDAIIANPPYVRHHNLPAQHKLLARHYTARLRSKVSSLSGSYVYFFLEAILRLNEGGRLVFITPTEFLDVRYGRAVKEALLSHCRLDEVLVLEMDELAFDGVLTTSAITVATKRTSSSRRFRLVEGRLNGSIERLREVQLPTDTGLAAQPWTPLLPSRAERIAPLLEGRTARLGDYCRVRRGIATGDNSFFALTRAQVEEWEIEERFLVPVVVGSKDLPTKGPLDADFHHARVEAGARGYLFLSTSTPRPCAARMRSGTSNMVGTWACTERFNCRTRSPWYGVEPVAPADFFTTYMSRDRARIVRN